MARVFPNAVTLSHKFISEVVCEGDTVIDATVGNGGDTLFLAELVGPKGRVVGFDTQVMALTRAQQRLRDAGLFQQVTLIHTGHENLINHISGPVKACMFNLGYLPGSQHNLITLPETTKAALGQAMGILVNTGMITLVVYTGHPGGAEEAGAIEHMTTNLPQTVWDVSKITFPNRKNFPPYLITIQKR